MSNSLKLFLEIAGDGAKLRDALRRSGSDVNSWGRKVREEARQIRSVYDSIAGRMAALGLSVGVGAMIWQSGKLDKSLAQIGQTAGASAKDVASLRKDLFRLGKESGQDVDELKEGFNILVQSGLDMKEARETLSGLNTAMAVSGANAKTLANGLTVAATAFEFDLSKPGQALELLDKMTMAGRLGSAELEDLSNIFARVGVNAKSAGMSFDSTLAFVEVLSKVEKQPERLATLADSTLRIFTNMRYRAEAQKATGVKFFDKDGARRDAFEILKDLQAKYRAAKTDKQREDVIAGAFGKADQDTAKGMRQLFAGPSLSSMGRFTKNIAEAGGTLKRDLGDATSNMVDQTGRLKASLREAADNFTKPINQTLADLIKWGLDAKKNGGLELSGKEVIGYGAGGALGTLLLARYGAKAVEWLRGSAGKNVSGGVVDALKSRAATAGRIGEFLAVQAGAKAIGVNLMPVYVTNWPEGMKGSRGPTETTEDKLKDTSRARKMLETLRASVPRIKDWLAAKNLPYLPRQVLLPAAVGYGVGWLANKGAGAIAGMASGGKYSGAGWLGQMVYDMKHRDAALTAAVSAIKPQVNNDIHLEIKIERDDRIIASTGDMNTDIVTTLQRGAF